MLHVSPSRRSKAEICLGQSAKQEGREDSSEDAVADEARSFYDLIELKIMWMLEQPLSGFPGRVNGKVY